MKKPEHCRTRLLNFRVTQAEYDGLLADLASTDFASMTDLLRARALGHPEPSKYLVPAKASFLPPNESTAPTEGR